MNFDPIAPIEGAANILRLLGQPSRLRILLAIGDQETCVCHLEACLGYRQAYISQQMKLLRDSGLVRTRREGKHIFYWLSDPSILIVAHLAAEISGFSEQEIAACIPPRPVPDCPCPHCAASAPRSAVEQSVHPIPLNSSSH